MGGAVVAAALETQRQLLIPVPFMRSLAARLLPSPRKIATSGVAAVSNPVANVGAPCRQALRCMCMCISVCVCVSVLKNRISGGMKVEGDISDISQWLEIPIVLSLINALCRSSKLFGCRALPRALGIPSLNLSATRSSTSPFPLCVLRVPFIFPPFTPKMGMQLCRHQ